MAAEQQVEAGKAVTYTVTVEVSSVSTLRGAAADCTLSTGESGTGLLNLAELTSQGETLHANTCRTSTLFGLPQTGVSQLRLGLAFGGGLLLLVGIGSLIWRRRIVNHQERADR